MTEPIHELPSTPDNDWNWGAMRFTPEDNDEINATHSPPAEEDAGREPGIALATESPTTFEGIVGHAPASDERVPVSPTVYWPDLNPCTEPIAVTPVTGDAVVDGSEPSPSESKHARTPDAPTPETGTGAAPSVSTSPNAPLSNEPRDPLVLGSVPTGSVGIAAVLEEAVARRASDVHINAGSPPMLRIDGSLVPSNVATAFWAPSIIDRELLPLLNSKRKDTFKLTNELDFTFTANSGARFRTNYFRQQGNVGAAFRHVPDEIRSLQQLGIADSIARLAHLPRGLVLVTGPTGSGKSTTLASLIDLVNETRAGHIVTIEDPIEFVHPRKRSIVDQREVGHDTDSFAIALRQVLRQDPDVILVGEMRDLETISVALTAAETGHLVFATLHTQTASTTIDRILDVFPAHQQSQVRAQLSNSLQAVVSQTLLRRADKPGRAAATEILLTTAAVANLIREGKTFQIPTAIQSGGSLGMHTLDQSLAGLVNEGVVSIEEAESKVIDQESFSRLLKPGAAHQIDRRNHGFER